MSLSLFCESGIGSVTGANFRLVYTHAGHTYNFLIDCGLIQGTEEAEKLNEKEFPYDPAHIDCLIVTHAHLDHVGRIPKLIKDGFKGVIYSTPATKDLARLILDDAVGLLTRSADKRNVEPLYTRAHVEQSFTNWQTFDYHISKEIFPNLSVNFKDAGHILGSAMVQVTTAGVTTVFSGDLGNTPAPL